jgi:hypothetical protein
MEGTMAKVVKIQIDHRFRIDLGDRGIVELGGDFEAESNAGVSQTGVQLAHSILKRTAKETTATEAKVLLTKIENETPFDRSIPGSTFQLLRTIIVDGGLALGEHKFCQECGKPLPAYAEPQLRDGEPIFLCEECADLGEV